MKLSKYGIDWGGPNNNWYYIHPRPNWLPPKYRYWGYQKMYYDAPHASFGFWWFNISWSTPWTKWSTKDWDS